MAERPVRRAGPGPAGPPANPRPTGAGPGRVLIAVYGFFALAAGARAGWQLATRFEEAPVAYLLSALAAAIYLVAAVGLATGGDRARRAVLACCTVELAGVLIVGTASLALPDAFGRATVWSNYGAGYGFVPLVLPVLGLLWLWHTRPRQP
jgi:hypothetical protein